jgi:hypothetical protein
LLILARCADHNRQRQDQVQKDTIMRSKKETRFLLPSMRRLLANMLHDAAVLAHAHPMVIATSPAAKKSDAQGTQPTRN